MPGAPNAIPLPAKDIDFGADLAIEGGGHDEDEVRLRWARTANAHPPLPEDVI